jgi:tetratricopeptide (TPR) repeat protein
VGTHNAEGFILAENGKPEEAMKHFDMASEKIESSNLPDNLKDNLMSDVKLNKLYGMVAANKLDAASNELQSKDQVLGSANTPQNEKKYEAIMGLLSLKQNKFDEALSHFDKADNEDPMTWYYQAMAYQKKGDTQKATQLIDKIKQSNQNSVELAVANNHAKEIVAQTK